ncbi:mitochondrial inner-membrane-bound regulator-domain-containing protein [Xylariaceae sp. FL0016]|nr:mitochondrial inner-membrane-bound regulator-domain-containing protein [Xylariaceae sp. FL0016]
MFTRGSTGGAVCFRCQLRLLRRNQQLPHPLLLKSLIQQRQPLRRCFATESHPDSDPALARDASATANTQGSTSKPEEHAEIEGEGHARPGKSKPRFKRPDFRKRRLSGNRVLTENFASLGSDMLGKPAYAIVLKDQGVRRRRNTSQPTVESLTDDGSTSNQLRTDIEALLDDRHRRPTIDEVRANIDSLEPTGEKVLSEKEFRELQNELTKGFLSAQLHDYLEWKLPEPIQDVVDANQYPWIMSISPWVPLKDASEHTSGTNPNLQGYISESRPAKERLVIRIMRERWGLSIAEFSTTLGELQIKLQPQDFTLLMRGTQRFIKTLAKLYLNPGETIEAFRNRQTLRLVCSKTKARTLIKDLNETLGKITTKTFPIGLVTSGDIDDAVLEEVAGITNTNIRRSKTDARLHVSWIEINAREKQGLVGLEDMREVVVRLLRTAYAPPRAASTTQIPRAMRDRTCRFLPDSLNKSKLGWKDRLLQWARYVVPLQRPTPTPSTSPLTKLQLPFEPQEATRSRDATICNPDYNFSADPQYDQAPVRWSDFQTSTVARFGHVLHSYEMDTPSSPSLEDLLASSSGRLFAPLTPHPLKLSQLESSRQEPTKPLSTLIFRFWPSPALGDKSKPEFEESFSEPRPSHADAPVLELRIRCNDNKIAGIQSLRAIKRTHQHELLLPASAVDLAVEQSTYAQLEANDPAAIATWQPLADFLAPSRLDLEKSKIEVPPRQTFHIPARLFANFPDETDPSRLVKTNYSFVGMEMHQSISLDHDGHRFVYTSIEAGQGGGRRAELTYEPLLPLGGDADGSKVDLESIQADFLRKSYAFATSKEIWSGIEPSQDEAE